MRSRPSKANSLLASVALAALFGAAGLLSAGLAPAALAQQPAQVQQPAQAQRPSGQVPAAGQDPMAARRGEGANMNDVANATAEALIGRDADLRDGTTIGEVVDVLIDGRTGKIQSLIVKADELDEIQERTVEIPFSHVLPQPSSAAVAINLPRDQITRLPQWTYERIGDGIVGLRQPGPTQVPGPTRQP